ncbi:hypothetical protein GGR50DRAFT_309856 [Xylaria sp. CBS 124048]|nr:hypothetical protein GGR50DRAFT_309856 [Xylaria sp. CBS 124048]
MSGVYASNNTAVITGAASGIGLAIAQKCIGYGMRVLIADLDQKKLDDVQAMLGTEKASVIRLDVGKFEDWTAVKQKIEFDFGGQLNLLVLNAGMQVPTSFADADPTGFQKTLATNFFGIVNGITALLPLVQRTSAKQAAAVVITGSKQGITNPPGNPAYNASKSAVKALAEHLSFDLATSHPKIGVHFLVPGWTWTPMAGAGPDGKKEKPAAAWATGQVADYLVEKMAGGQFWILCPDNDVTEAMDRRRMLWTADDAILGRAPLSRWRGEYKDEFQAWMEKE